MMVVEWVITSECHAQWPPILASHPFLSMHEALVQQHIAVSLEYYDNTVQCRTCHETSDAVSSEPLRAARATLAIMKLLWYLDVLTQRDILNKRALTIAPESGTMVYEFVHRTNITMQLL